MLRKIYTFLFIDHIVGFMCFCYAMLIPCALSRKFCAWWMVFVAFLPTLVIQAEVEGWDK